MILNFSLGAPEPTFFGSMVRFFTNFASVVGVIWFLLILAPVAAFLEIRFSFFLLEVAPSAVLLSFDVDLGLKSLFELLVSKPTQSLLVSYK